jgi:predicted DNA-binding transcriptional regulator YafY
MDRTERLYRIDRLLNERRVVSVEAFLEELEVSLATFKRDLEYLRDRLNAPVVWDRELRGYRFEQQGAGEKYELPGLWFKASEIHALLTMQQLLSSLGPGLLTPHIEPLLTRLRLLLDREGIPFDAVGTRIRILSTAARAYEPKYFGPVTTGVLQRRRLVVDHYSRARNENIRREVSPQRLTHYRGNWYVDAFCHLRNELRSFSLDAIRGVWLGTETAVDVSAPALHDALDSGYGIFGGDNLEWAELTFSATRARWVSNETWHPEQKGQFGSDGCFHLSVPFTNPTELVMDILRHVPDVKVDGPKYLRELVAKQLSMALENL